MKAAVIHALGQPPRFEDFPEPTAGEGEVGVNVRAAGLHPFVRAQASGSQSGSPNVFPQIPGIDGVGSLDDGTRVYFDKARPPYGTMAERCVVLREMIFPIPDRLDDLTAAALFNPGLTSWLAFTRAQLTKGETVLIVGATEAVIAAIARLDVTQGAPSVRLIDLGQIAGPTITLPAFVLRSSGLLISGIAVALTTIERLREAIPQLIAEAASGTLRIETEPVPLAQIEAAWQQQTPDNRRLVVLP